MFKAPSVEYLDSLISRIVAKLDEYVINHSQPAQTYAKLYGHMDRETIMSHLTYIDNMYMQQHAVLRSECVNDDADVDIDDHHYFDEEDREVAKHIQNTNNISSAVSSESPYEIKYKLVVFPYYIGSTGFTSVYPVGSTMERSDYSENYRIVRGHLFRLLVLPNPDYAVIGEFIYVLEWLTVRVEEDEHMGRWMSGFDNLLTQAAQTKVKLQNVHKKTVWGVSMDNPCFVDNACGVKNVGQVNAIDYPPLKRSPKCMNLPLLGGKSVVSAEPSVTSPPPKSPLNWDMLDWIKPVDGTKSGWFPLVQTPKEFMDTSKEDGGGGGADVAGLTNSSIWAPTKTDKNLGLIGGGGGGSIDTPKPLTIPTCLPLPPAEYGVASVEWTDDVRWLNSCIGDVAYDDDIAWTACGQETDFSTKLDVLCASYKNGDGVKEFSDELNKLVDAKFQVTETGLVQSETHAQPAKMRGIADGDSNSSGSGCDGCDTLGGDCQHVRGVKRRCDDPSKRDALNCKKRIIERTQYDVEKKTATTKMETEDVNTTEMEEDVNTDKPTLVERIVFRDQSKRASPGAYTNVIDMINARDDTNVTKWNGLQENEMVSIDWDMYCRNSPFDFFNNESGVWEGHTRIDEGGVCVVRADINTPYKDVAHTNFFDTELPMKTGCNSLFRYNANYNIVYQNEESDTGSDNSWRSTNMLHQLSRETAGFKPLMRTIQPRAGMCGHVKGVGVFGERHWDFVKRRDHYNSSSKLRTYPPSVAFGFIIAPQGGDRLTTFARDNTGSYAGEGLRPIGPEMTVYTWWKTRRECQSFAFKLAQCHYHYAREHKVYIVKCMYNANAFTHAPTLPQVQLVVGRVTDGYRGPMPVPTEEYKNIPGVSYSVKRADQQFYGE